MADFESCIKYQMDLCPIARHCANKKGVKLDCSKCKDYASANNKCGDCKHYDTRDTYCGVKHEYRFFHENSAACDDYEERREEMRVKKQCYSCKHYSHGACLRDGSLMCGEEMKYWELSDDAKADLLYDAEPEHDAVNSPAYYTSGGIECIDCIKAALGENFIGFLIGNVIKYSYRYKDKNGAEDLKKARWYLDRAIKEITDEES